MLTGRAWRYLSDSARAFERAPAEVTIALCVAASWSWAVELKGDAFPRFLEIAVTGLLMAACAWAGTLLHGLRVISLQARWSITLAGAVLAGLYGWRVVNVELGAEAWRAAMLAGAAVLGIAVLPVLARRAPAATGNAATASPDGTPPARTTRDDGAAAVDRMRIVTGRLLLRVLGALLYCAALFAGLALALGAINTLFEMNLQNEIYGHVFGWIFLALAPWIVVGGLPEYVAPVSVRTEVASVVHRMTAFLVPPLLVLYYAILYAYTVRIAVSGEIPNNIVSPMVFAAGALALLGLLLFDPRPNGSAGARTLRLAPALFVPLSVLGAWSIAVRVNQYGWTEFRLLRLVLLVAFGALAVAAATQVARRRRLSLHVPLIVLGAVLALAAAGPWSIMDVSRRSQQARLAEGLADVGIDPAQPRPAAVALPGLPAGTAPVGGMPADSARPLPAEQFDRINDTARYLVQHFGAGALPPALAATGAIRDNVFNMAGALGFRREHPAQPEQRFVFAQIGGEATLSVGGVSAHRVFAGPRRDGPATGNASLSPNGRELTVRAGGELFRADLTPLLDAAAAGTDRRRELTAAEARLPAIDAEGTVRGALLVLELNVETTGQGALVLHMLHAVLLVQPR